MSNLSRPWMIDNGITRSDRFGIEGANVWLRFHGIGLEKLHAQDLYAPIDWILFQSQSKISSEQAALINERKGRRRGNKGSVAFITLLA